MNRVQKIAWCQLAVLGLFIIASIFNSLLYMQKYGYIFFKAWWLGSASPMVLCFFLMVLAPVFFHSRKGQINFDERDLKIDRRAARIAFGASFAFFIVVCIITWLAVGLDSLIPAYWLTRIVFGGWITAATVPALTVILCYGWSNKGEKS